MMTPKVLPFSIFLMMIDDEDVPFNTCYDDCHRLLVRSQHYNSVWYGVTMFFFKDSKI
jgi:hypothetical protein